MHFSRAEESLLFGILALQRGLISREQLISATNAWISDKSKPIGQIFVEQGAVDEDSRDLLEKLVQKHLTARGNAPEKSLTAVRVADSVQEELRQLGDDEIDATLSYLPCTHEDESEGSEAARPVTHDNAGEATEVHQSAGLAGAAEATEAHRSGTHGDELPSTVMFEPGRSVSANTRFRILRVHAKGGLGLVSVASDEELHREVAFKELLEHCADDSDAQARFILEAEITGRLEHPGIVPVYGFGVHVDGRPFYVMRFIRGESLKTAISRFHKAESSGKDPGRQALEFRQLLNRFIDVCDAIQYAHSRGVVHRDLKPDNIMLGQYGETLVVDWGVAKSVDRLEESTSAAEATLRPISGSVSAPTQTGSVIGTPAYMSPEQAEGRPDQVGPASDVYSLGATLHSLLTNRKSVEATSVIDLLEKVRTGDFSRPRDVNPRVPVAMEAICLKAMALAPANRYPTSRALAEDIEHWLADEPVSAYRETLLERTGRWMRRHRSWTLAAAASLLIVAAVSVAATLMINRARQRANVLAARNLQLAEDERAASHEALLRFREARNAVDTWLTGAGEALKFYPGAQEARKRLLQQAATDYESFAKQRSDDVRLELERGRTYLRLGDVRKTLGEAPEAEEAYRSAETLLEQLAQNHPDDPDFPLELANSRVKSGLLLAQVGRHAEAHKLYNSAAGALRALVDNDSDEPRFRDALGSCLLNHGLLYTATGPQERAKDLIRQSMDQFESLLEAHSETPRYREGLASVQNVLGQILFQEGNDSEALLQLNEAISSFGALAAADPTAPKYLESLASTRILLASVLRRLGRLDEESKTYHDAIADYQALTAALPDVPLYRENLAITWTDLAQLLHQLGQTARAKVELDNALTTFVELSLEYPQFPRYHEEQAACRDNLGRVLGDLDRDEEAKSSAQSAVETYQQLVEMFPTVPEYRERLAVGKNHFGQILHKLDDHAAAHSSYTEAIEILDELMQLAPEQPSFQDELAFTCRHLGVLLQDTGQTAEAQTAFGRAEDVWLALIERSEAPQYLNNLAWFLANCADPHFRDPERAIALAVRAKEMVPENPRYHGTLGAAYYRADKSTAAIAILHDAIRLRGEGTARDWFFLAMAQRRLGQSDEAKENFVSGCQWMEENRPGNPELRRIREEARLSVEETRPDSPPEDPRPQNGPGAGPEAGDNRRQEWSYGSVLRGLPPTSTFTRPGVMLISRLAASVRPKRGTGTSQ